mgnify:CR=1 FL=1
MEDSAIISLYWARDEGAIAATDRKYGALCRSLSQSILASREDAEECVNDTWLRSWNAMPPQRPGVLSAFFGKITRNLSLDRWRKNRAAKRGGSQVEVALLELEDCHRLDLALDLAQNLQHYEFFPRGMDLAAYGRELAVRNGVIPPSRLITDAFDGAAYAEANMGQYGLSTTDHGYVAWNGGERRYEYSQPEHHSPALSI